MIGCTLRATRPAAGPGGSVGGFAEPAAASTIPATRPRSSSPRLSPATWPSAVPVAPGPTAAAVWAAPSGRLRRPGGDHGQFHRDGHRQHSWPPTPPKAAPAARAATAGDGAGRRPRYPDRGRAPRSTQARSPTNQALGGKRVPGAVTAGSGRRSKFPTGPSLSKHRDRHRPQLCLHQQRRRLSVDPGWFPWWRRQPRAAEG